MMNAGGKKCLMDDKNMQPSMEFCKQTLMTGKMEQYSAYPNKVTSVNVIIGE